MIEVDVFWSFAFGASFAAFAQESLRAEEKPFVNEWFLYTLVFLSTIFAPSGIYLLWAFPGWESMFVLGHKACRVSQPDYYCAYFRLPICF